MSYHIIEGCVHQVMMWYYTFVLFEVLGAIAIQNNCMVDIWRCLVAAIKNASENKSLQIKCLVAIFFVDCLHDISILENRPVNNPCQPSMWHGNFQSPKKCLTNLAPKKIHDKPPIKPLHKKRSSSCKTSSQMSTYQGSFLYHSSFTHGLCPRNS